MQPLPARLRTIDLHGIRQAGAALAAHRAIDWLSADGTSGYWIHLDVDVLDDAIMPAVDYRLPGGLTWAELETALRTAMTGDRAVGIDVTIFNPRLDPGGRIAVRLVECLHHGLTDHR
jgi:arginase